MSDKSSRADERVRAAIAAVQARHDAPLPEEGMEQLERMVHALQRSADALASYALTNFDEPVGKFVAREGK